MLPALAGLILQLVAFLIPEPHRKYWLAKRHLQLKSLTVLIDRGEYVCSPYWPVFDLIIRSASDAAGICLRSRSARVVLASPLLPFAVLGLALGVTAIWSEGFAQSRSILTLAFEPAPPGGSRSDSVFLHLTALLYSAVHLIVALMAHRSPMHAPGWRSFTYLFLKTAAASVVLYVAWIETGAGMRSLIPVAHWRLLLGGLLWSVGYLCMMPLVLHWLVDDQRKRCPVCLRRMSLPVSIGLWSSILEPPRTELICDAGHGSLCLSERENDSASEWVALDASWEELFTTH